MLLSLSPLLAENSGNSGIDARSGLPPFLPSSSSSLEFTCWEWRKKGFCGTINQYKIQPSILFHLPFPTVVFWWQLETFQRVFRYTWLPSASLSSNLRVCSFIQTWLRTGYTLLQSAKCRKRNVGMERSVVVLENERERRKEKGKTPLAPPLLPPPPTTVIPSSSRLLKTFFKGLSIISHQASVVYLY